MDADRALTPIKHVYQRARALSDHSSHFLLELSGDLQDARKVELTQEDWHELRAICERTGVVWEDVEVPERS